MDRPYFLGIFCFCLFFRASFLYQLSDDYTLDDIDRITQYEDRRQKRSTGNDGFEFIPEEREKCKNKDREISPKEVDTTKRLEALRKLMKNQKYIGHLLLEAYIIPSEDAHMSEYTSDYDKRRRFITGFSGSQGVAVVTQKKAALYIDSRYFIEAEESVDCNWILMKLGTSYYQNLIEFLIQNVQSGQRVGIDPTLIDYSDWNSREETLQKYGIKLTAIDQNLIDVIWTTNRPPEPNSNLTIMPFKFSGQSWNVKVERVRTEMNAKKNVVAAVLTKLEDIAWLFNLRGEDIPFVPVFMSYTIVEFDKVTLYIKKKYQKLKPEIIDHLNTTKDGNCGDNKNCVWVKDYSECLHDLDKLNRALMEPNGEEDKKRIWISKRSSYRIYSLVVSAHRFIMPLPVGLMRIVKNKEEIEAMKDSHIRDSAALISFLAMLEESVKKGEKWTELKAAKTVDEYRSKVSLNRGISFQTISSSGPNSASNHYTPSPTSDRPITKDEIYLLDSGGQYLDGTTDVTRTMFYGKPSDWYKESYTRVLMGSTDLAKAIWADGWRRTEFLDSLARKPLWENGMGYGHGTGHGIGIYLNVHEGPAGIPGGSKMSPDSIARPGMFFSDEPGYYETGKFGIRLESILLVVPSDIKVHFGYRYFTFEPITLVPFEPNLIKTELLDAAQRKWLNTYNQKCLKEVGPILLKNGDTRAYKWLEDRTRQIKENPCPDPPKKPLPSPKPAQGGDHSIGFITKLPDKTTVVFTLLTLISCAFSFGLL